MQPAHCPCMQLTQTISTLWLLNKCGSGSAIINTVVSSVGAWHLNQNLTASWPHKVEETPSTKNFNAGCAHGCILCNLPNCQPLQQRTLCCTRGDSCHHQVQMFSSQSCSITEGELIKGILGSKDVVCTCSVMTDLGFPQTEPTRMHIDNAASVLIANTQRPTPHTHHMDVHWFAIQHWVELGLIFLHHIPGLFLW